MNRPCHQKKKESEKPLPPGDRALVQMHTAAVLDLAGRKFSAQQIAAKLRIQYRIVRAILSRHE